jgi:putative transposase
MSRVRGRASKRQRQQSLQQSHGLKQRRHQGLKQITVPLDDGTLSISANVAMIQALIPLGLRAVEDALQQEVKSLAGAKYARDDEASETAGIARWGSQAGSVFLADQKLPIQVPRVRDLDAHREVPLSTYQQLQTPRSADAGLFHRVLAGISCREYEAAAEAVPEVFGLAKSSVSRRFIRSSAKSLRALQERRHDDREWFVLLLDGKTFAHDQMVIALGVTVTGEKRILGVVQTATENKRVCAAFLRELESADSDHRRVVVY